MQDKRITLINIISAVALQVVTIISGFIIPRVMLINFGSEVNGLVSSITQFLNYISLLEGGVGAVLATSFYVPLTTKDEGKISSIVSASNSFFKKLAKIFLIYSLVVAAVYPLIVKNDYGFIFVFTLTIILSVSLFMQYNFSITWRILLKADRKVYVSSIIDLIAIVIHTVLIIIAVKIFAEVRFVRLIAAFSYVLQPILYNFFVNKNYKLDKSAVPDKSALAQRWDGFGINLAAFLNNNIDVMVLAVLSSLKNVSIYSVYALVTTGISSLIKSVSSGFNPTLGRAYAKNDQRETNRILSRFENIIMFFSFSIYTCAAVLIVPFVLTYTKGVNDANYDQKVFALILLASSLMFCLREPYVNMSYIANKFHEVSKFAYIEAAINIVVSVAAVRFFGLNGVAFGTLCSMSFRTIYQVLFIRNKIVNRSVFIFVVKTAIFAGASVAGYFVSSMFINSRIKHNWLSWISNGIVCAAIVFVLNAVIFGIIIIFERKHEYK